MRLLVTGATGFLGGRLVPALLQQDHQVTALGRNPARMPEGAQLLLADLRDPAAILDACRNQDAVIHAGAFSAPWGRAADFEEINVGGTRHIVEGCRAHRVGRLLFISSPSVLSNGHDQVNLDDDAPYPTRPISLYSLSKRRAEEIIHAARDVPSVILRPKAIFGPGDTTLLPRLLTAARRGRLPQVGNGSNQVDLTYVDNVVAATLLSLVTPSAIGKCYTITNDEHPYLWQVIRSLLRQLDIPAHLRPVPISLLLLLARAMAVRAAITGREPLLTRYSVLALGRTQTHDIRAAKEDLGYVPHVSLTEGLRRTVAHLKGEAVW